MFRKFGFLKWLLLTSFIALPILPFRYWGVLMSAVLLASLGGVYRIKMEKLQLFVFLIWIRVSATISAYAIYLILIGTLGLPGYMGVTIAIVYFFLVRWEMRVSNLTDIDWKKTSI